MLKFWAFVRGRWQDLSRGAAWPAVPWMGAKAAGSAAAAALDAETPEGERQVKSHAESSGPLCLPVSADA